MFSTYLSRWKHHFVRIQRGSLEQTIQSFRIKIGFRALARSLFTKDNNFPHRLWRLFLQEKWSAISVTRLGKISPLCYFFWVYKTLNLLWLIIMFWGKFHYCQWPNIEEIIQPSGHTVGRQLLLGHLVFLPLMHRERTRMNAETQSRSMVQKIFSTRRFLLLSNSSFSFKWFQSIFASGRCGAQFFYSFARHCEWFVRCRLLPIFGLFSLGNTWPCHLLKF